MRLGSAQNKKLRIVKAITRPIFKMFNITLQCVVDLFKVLQNLFLDKYLNVVEMLKSMK